MSRPIRRNASTLSQNCARTSDSPRRAVDAVRARVAEVVPQVVADEVQPVVPIRRGPVLSRLPALPRKVAAADADEGILVSTPFQPNVAPNTTSGWLRLTRNSRPRHEPM